jgi:flagella synthesis protein FlgN
MSKILLSYVLQEIDLIKELVDLLNQEEQAMLKGDFDKLPNLAKNKIITIDKTAKVSLERITKQVTLGFDQGKSGADDAAKEAGNGSVYQDKWLELINLSRTAHNSNTRNGVMIHTHLNYIDKSIRFIKESDQSLYSSNGASQLRNLKKNEITTC